MESAQQRLHAILGECKKSGVDVSKLKKCHEIVAQINKQNSSKTKKVLKFLVSCLIVFYCLKYFRNEMQSSRCLVELPRPLSYAFRPPEKCNFCRNVKSVVRLRDITSDEFEARYAYTGVPVIVEDATKNWTALTKFNYWYFRDVYKNAKRRQKILDCQFLPYKTGFRNIFEALDMPVERVNLAPETDPWYFGWSNCNPETAEEFRRHYGRPYFLPKTSENNAVDWFFIGTAGLGAHMHIDNVRLPSWQAQLSGSKRWILAPPPECYFQCQKFDAVVKKGDIIVLDTNKWYHQTFVQPGEISLTIGAEYD